MNQQVKHLWTAALRSGLYRKCTIGFHWGGGYSPLGLLELLAFEAGVVKEFDPERVVLSREVVNWADLDRPSPVVAGGVSLAWLSDSGGTFLETAERIERWL